MNRNNWTAVARQAAGIFIPASLAVLGLFRPAIYGQTAIDLRSQSRNVDFSAATSTRPNKSGTTLPGACGVGDTFFKTDESAGRNLYGCTAANTWTQLGSGNVSAGTGIAVTGLSVATDDAVVPYYAVGSGAPSITCQPGRDFYTDVNAGVLYFCKSANTWQATGGSSSSGSSSWNPVDFTTAWAVEEFIGGTVTNGAIGVSGLARSAVGTSGTPSNPAAPAGHPGILRINTGTAAGTGDWISLGYAVSSAPNGVASSEWANGEWEVQIILSPGANGTGLSGIRLRAGLHNGTSGEVGSVGAYVRYDTTLGDTTFKYQICDSVGGCGQSGDGADSMVEDSGVTPAAGSWYRLRIRRVLAGTGGSPTIYFTINEANPKTFCSTGCDGTLAEMPSVGGMVLQAGYINSGTGVKSCDLDWMSFQIRGLTRN